MRNLSQKQILFDMRAIVYSDFPETENSANARFFF
jgi:hypothetical protein